MNLTPLLASLLSFAFLLLVAGKGRAAEAAPASATPRPNVLFILCDDLRPDALGCYGSKHVRTPNIDALAKDGVRFANAFCTTSLCSPSRASILTGLYAHRHGVRDNSTEIARGPGLPAGRIVTGQVLAMDTAPSIVDLCGATPLGNVQGRSWRALAHGSDPGWRTAWFYEYNYERQFPYTPNIRGIRTDDWKYVRYPHGDGSPDRHNPELYHLAVDPGELHNLAADPGSLVVLRELDGRLTRMLADEGLTPDRDRMPIDEGVKKELPDQKIR